MVFFIGHEKIVLNFLMNNAMSMTSGHETQAVGQGTCANNLFWVRLIFKERERNIARIANAVTITLYSKVTM